MLLNYEANNHSYLYSSDGVPTFISMGELDIDTIMALLKEHGAQIEELQANVADLTSSLAEETAAREAADTETNNKLELETSNRTTADQALQSSIIENKEALDGLSTVVNDVSEELDKAQNDIVTLRTGLAEETSNRTTADNLLQSSIETESATRAQADENLETSISEEATTRANADAQLQDSVSTNTTAINNIEANLDVYVEKETEFNSGDSTLDVVHTKVNLKDNTIQETTDALPVASTTSAGIMNAATFSAIQENSENIDSILVGAVALENLPASPTQAELTTAWENATGKTELVNRASIYDITNQKLWYYYTNTTSWYGQASGEGSTVTVSQATNTSLGTVKGSTLDGQNFVEADGSLSVNGWDGAQERLSNLENGASETNSQLATLQGDYVSKTDIKTIGGESIIGTGDITIPKLYDSYSTATDGANTTKFINDKLNSRSISLGSDSSAAQNTSSISIGSSTKSTTADTVLVGSGAKGLYASVALGNNAWVQKTYSAAIGYSSSVTRDFEFSVGATADSGYDGNIKRYVSNVKAGELDNDAVNVKQMEDYVAENAPIYTLPIASSAELGGVKVGGNLQISTDGTLSVNIPEATATAAGLMSSADKTTVSNIEYMTIDEFNAAWDAA